ncbi:MAG: hypothetical protein ACM3JJ_09930 [Hyphomicrobiales bacterium]
MERTNLRLLVGLASILCFASGASAAPPGSSTGPSTTRTPGTGAQTKIEEIQSIGVDRQLTTFTGVVLDVNERPLANVSVKLFVDGQLVASTGTESNGFYSLKVPYDATSDETALLWFLPPERSLMAKELVLKESKASAAAGVISKCVPRAKILPGRQFRVYLFDAANRNKELAELECLP